MTVSLTILIPTIGRPTLERTLQSIAGQDLCDGDEVLLVHDGPDEEKSRGIWESFSLPGRLIGLPDGPHRDWGHTPRNRFMTEARGDYLIHLDDDDTLAANALITIRTAIQSEPGRLFLFRMQYADGRTLWTKRIARIGHVGTPMFVHPRDIRLGTWQPRQGGDGAFIGETIALNEKHPLVWREEIIAHVRPREPTQDQPPVP